MADEPGDFRFAGAYIDLNIRDNTAAGLEDVRRKIQDEKPVEIPTTFGTPTNDPVRDHPIPPVTVPTEATNPIDDAWRAKLAAAVKATAVESLDIPLTPENEEFRLEVRAMLEQLRASVKAQIPTELADADKYRLEVEALARQVSDQVHARLKVEVDPESAAKAKAEIAALAELASRVPVSQDPALAAGAAAAAGGTGGGIGRAGLFGGAGALGAGALEGGALLTVPAIFTAIGAAAEHSDSQVAAAFGSMADAAKKTTTTAFQPMIPALEQVANEAKSTIVGLEPQFAGAAVAAGPLIESVGHGFLQATQQGIGASVPILQSMRPVAQALGDDLVKVEEGLAGFFQHLDVGQAAAGLSAVGNVIRDVLPALGSLLSDVAPLGTALLNVLGPAVSTVAGELGFLRPIAQAAGTALQALSPEISALAGPVLAVEVATKLMTGSWTDWGGALSKVKPLFTDTSATLEGFAGKLGYTTDAAKKAAVAAAEQALEDAKLAASKAVLTAEVDAAAAAQAKETAETVGSAEAKLAYVEAQERAAASAAAATVATEAETAATEELTAAEEASQFALGPLGLVLGALGGVLALVGLNSDSATQSIGDLSDAATKLADSTHSAIAGLVEQDPKIAYLVNQLGKAGVSMEDFQKAANGDKDAQARLNDEISKSQKVLIDQAEAYGLGYDAMVKLGAAISGNKDAYDSLDPRLKVIAEHISALRDVQTALGDAEGTNTQRTSALNAVNAQGRDASTQWTSAITQAAQQSRLFGGDLLGTTQQMYQFQIASGETTLNVEAFQKAQLSAAQANFSAEDSFKQLDQAVASAGQQVQQAADSVANARHSEEESARSVADAEENVRTAVQGVATAHQNLANAERATEQAVLSVTTATLAETQARKAAQQQLEDMARQVHDQAGSEEAAQLRLLQAQQAVHAAGLDNTQLKLTDLYTLSQVNPAYAQQYQLLLDLQDAQDNLNDTLANGARLRQQNNDAVAAGIDGNSQVVAAAAQVQQAQQQVAQAQQQQAAAAQALITAQQGVAKANQQVTDAEYAQRQAHLATQQAIQSEHVATAALSAAKQDASRTLDENTSQGVRNRQTIIQLYDAQIAAGKSTQDATAAVENETAKLGFARSGVDAVINSINSVPPTVAFSVVGQPSLDVTELIINAQAQGINVNSLGLPPSVVGNARRNVPTGSSYATGGPVDGVGGPTEDANLAFLSHGEFVQPVTSVDYYGGPFMEAIRQKQIPKSLIEAIPGFAAGGPVDLPLVGINDRLIAWDSLLGATSVTLGLLGARNVPTLPPKVTPPPIVPQSSGDSYAKYAGSSNLEGWIQDAIARTGVGASWDFPLHVLIGRESSGNPNAINLTDSNAKRGDPSRGLMQTIGATFEHYRDKGLPDNIYDPVANIVAGIHYIEARYGSIFNVQQANPNLPPKGYDQGGYAIPGRTLLDNSTGQPEMLLPVGMSRTLESINNAVSSGRGLGSSGDVHHHHHSPITLYANSSEDAHQVAARVQAEQQWQLQIQR